MANGIESVVSFWRQFFGGPLDKQRCAAPKAISSVRGRTHVVERFHCELLEDRRLLAADISALTANFSSLQVDPHSYDPAHVLVRFDESVASPRDYLSVASQVALRGIETAAALPLVAGLHKVALSAGLSVEAALDALRQDPHVLYAEPDYAV